MCKMASMHSQVRHTHYMCTAYRHTNLLHVCVHCPQTCDKSTHAHSGKHSAGLYTHTPLPGHSSGRHLPHFSPAQPQPHTRHTAPNLPQGQRSTRIPGERQTARRCASPGLAPLPIQQVLQVLRAVLLGAGAKPGCPGRREEVLRRNGRPLGPRGKGRVRTGSLAPASTTAC